MGLRADTKRSRRAVIGAAAIFCAAQVATCAGFDAAPERVRFAEARRILEQIDAMADRGPPEVVFFGSSRFRSAVDADRIEASLATLGAPARVLDASVTAGDLLGISFVFDTLIARGVSPRLAVIELSPETLSRRVRWINAHVVRHLPTRALLAFSDTIRAEGKFSRVAKSRLLPVYWYRSELLEWASGARGPYLGVPSAPGESVHDRPALTADGLGAIRRWLTGYEIAGVPMRTLARVLARARELGIEVVLVGVPVHRDHRALYTPAIESAYRRHVASLVGAGVSFVEWRDRLDDAAFLDNHHLTPAGADQFSRLAAAELIAPRLRAVGR